MIERERDDGERRSGGGGEDGGEEGTATYKEGSRRERERLETMSK